MGVQRIAINQKNLIVITATFKEINFHMAMSRVLAPSQKVSAQLVDLYRERVYPFILGYTLSLYKST